jgi:hypothetical protein
MKELDIITCLRDKRLLGHFIEDESTFASWFTFLRAFFGLKPESGDRERFEQHTGRKTWPSKPVNEVWVPVWCARRQILYNRHSRTLFYSLQKAQTKPW